MKTEIQRVSRMCVLAVGVFAAGVALGNESMSFNAARGGQIDCVACHACEEPTRDAPCLEPCPAQSEGAPALPHVRAEIPKVIMLDLLSEYYGGVLFNHAGHADMSALDGGCATCHHYSPADRAPPCRACHGVTPSADNLRQPGLRGAYHRQCFGCHRDWSHETGCDKCHAISGTAPLRTIAKEGTDIVGASHPPLSPAPKYVYEAPDAFGTRVTFHHADHVNVFGLGCAACHAEESCRNCHDVNGPIERVREEPHEDCIRCHEGWTEGNCAYCHSEGERPRFDHTIRTGLDLTGWHAELSCGACHSKPSVFTGLEAQCAACHEPDWQPEGFDHSSTGFELEETHREVDCLGCHTDGLGPRARCDVCHEETYGPEAAAEAGAESAGDDEGFTEGED